MTAGEQIIERFGLTERTDNYTDSPHADLWSGSGVSPVIRLPDQGWSRVDKFLDEHADATIVDEWCEWPYRIVWRIDSERTHVTYCEGDVSVLVARDDDAYKAIGASARKYYEGVVA